jgi:predicted ATPase
MLEKRPYNIVIEEPESHLYPDAQDALTRLIALFFNNTKSNLVLTTHSPIILTTIANLMFAYKQLNNKKNINLEAPVQEEYWIDPSEIGTYLIVNGSLKKVMIDELGIISHDEITEILSKLEKEFEKLLTYNSH